MVHLAEGRYKCDWRGEDVGLPFVHRVLPGGQHPDCETFEIITSHDGIDVRTIVVEGDERHRCERP